MNKLLIILLALLVITLSLLYFFGRTLWHPYWVKLMGKTTVAEVISQIEPKHDNYWQQVFNSKGLKQVPNKLAYLAFKDTKSLEVWAGTEDKWQLVTSYPILKTSGVLGPKLREGDRQVPEGLYKIIGLNPNSAFHLSMKLNYPNQFDWEKARIEGRDEPGSNIFIHGKESSIGCLAMGDDVIEKLFLLSHQIGYENIEVIISPTDFRKNQRETLRNLPRWTPELYAEIEQKLKDFQ